jgi:hypothetical protein
VRRLGRILLHAVTVLSLLLCVAMIALWVRSYWVQDRLSFHSPNYTWHGRVVRQDLLTFHSEWGVCQIQQWRWTGKGPYTEEGFGWERYPSFNHKFYGSPLNRLGFRFELISGDAPSDDEVEYSVTGVNEGADIHVPHWAVALSTAVLALRLLHRCIRRRRRRTANQCIACGYDLRATPDMCPECGASDNNLIAPLRETR